MWFARFSRTDDKHSSCEKRGCIRWSLEKNWLCTTVRVRNRNKGEKKKGRDYTYHQVKARVSRMKSNKKRKKRRQATFAWTTTPSRFSKNERIRYEALLMPGKAYWIFPFRHSQSNGRDMRGQLLYITQTYKGSVFLRRLTRNQSVRKQEPTIRRVSGMQRRHSEPVDA